MGFVQTQGFNEMAHEAGMIVLVDEAQGIAFYR